MMPMLQERRLHTRYVIVPRMYVALNYSSSGGVLNDVSEGGMALDILGPKPTSDTVILDMDLSEIGEHFETKCRITWSKESEHRLGLKFVDLTETSLQQINKWLANKSVAAELPQHVLVQDGANYGAPVQYPVRQMVKISKPASPLAVETAEAKLARSASYNPAVEAKSARVEIPVSAVRPIRAATSVPATPASALDLKSNRPAIASPTPRIDGIEPVTQTPENRDTSALTPETVDPLVSGLRSSFAQLGTTSVRSTAAEGKPEQAAYDLKNFSKWVIAAVVVFLLTLAMATARWVYTSPTFDKVASTSDIRDMVAGVFNPANAKAKPRNPDGAKAGHPRSRKNIPDRNLAPRNDVGAKGVAQVSGVQPASESLMQEKAGNKVGLVSVHPMSQVPERQVLPEYPTAALRNNKQGRVLIKAMISKDGMLQHVRLVGPPSIFSSPVLEALKKWRYQPRTENGVAVEVETQLTIDFKINAK